MRKVVTCLDEVDETYERTYAVTSKVYLHGPSFPNNDDPNGWKDREMMPLIFRWLRVMMFNLVNIMLMAWTLVFLYCQGYSRMMECIHYLERDIVAVESFVYC